MRKSKSNIINQKYSCFNYAFKLVTRIFLLFLCIFFYAYYIEPDWIEITSLQLTLPHLAREFDGYRIVQISDIHTDKWTKPERLSRIFNLVNQQKPDLVAITGDFVTKGQQRFIPNLKATLPQLAPKDKTVGVLGNHDYWSDPKGVAQALQETGVINLANSVYTIARGNAKLNIAGVDSISVGQGRPNLVLQKLPKEGAAILLVHEPDFADTGAAIGRFDLQLSGHSHAGQVRLPFIGPIFLPEYGKKYYEGLNKIGSMLEYTNRGLGVSTIHLRFGSRPEITVFKLKYPG